jgi:hypothetical protein
MRPALVFPSPSGEKIVPFGGTHHNREERFTWLKTIVMAE